MTTDLSEEPLLPAVEVGPADGAAAAVIWMHGLGADGHDFAPVVAELGLPPELAVRFVFPHAPRIPVTINQGLIMPAWYDIRSLDLNGQDEAGARRSDTRIRALLAREIERGVPSHRIVLAGFSQGGAMALFTGLRFPQRLAGLLVLSSFLLLPEAVLREATDANRALPVFQAHGIWDPMVPCELGRGTRDWLEERGHPVEWHEYPMAHQVCPDEIRAIGRWLGERLGPAGGAAEATAPGS